MNELPEITLAQALRSIANVEQVRRAMLQALEIPEDRWDPWHLLTVETDRWHMAHPITCDLGICPYDADADVMAQDLGPGVYRWSEHFFEPERVSQEANE